MLSRLISLLRRIPAVKWAFTRLRPLPHSGSIDASPIATDEPLAVIVDIADAAPACDTSTNPLHDDADVGASVAERDPDVSVESPSATPSGVSASNDLSEQAPIEITTAVGEQASVSSVDVETDPVEISDLVIDDDPTSSVSAEIEPVTVDETPANVVDTEISEPVVVEASLDSDPAPSVAAEIAPAPAPASSSPKGTSAPKARAKIAGPVDRAALIRQRWSETGIRMWNPRLHGTGEATLNIQGRVELLPPEPGETMPRYDKLEFKMLGGQIVCEGVIVEAPAQTSQRNFTRLAEPGKSDRLREPVRERQAVLA